MFMTNIVIQVLLVLGVLIAAYLFLIGPQLKRITEHNRLLSSLKLGDQVVGMSRPLLNSAGRALPVDDAMRLSVCSQVSAWSYAWRDAQPAP
ncbi:MAG: preprotein translocase subunit YajC, partial [Methyloceanibacter sp.]